MKFLRDFYFKVSLRVCLIYAIWWKNACRYVVKVGNRTRYPVFLWMEAHCQNPTPTNGFQICAVWVMTWSLRHLSLHIHPPKKVTLHSLSLAHYPIRFAQPDKSCHLKLRATRCAIFEKKDGQTGSQWSQHTLAQGWVNYGSEKKST
jgi:hypothetical protein